MALAIGKHLRRSGWQVAGFSRKQSIAESPYDFHYSVDAAKADQVAAAALAAAMEIDTADAFIYAAGDIQSAPLQASNPQDWQRIIQANLGGAAASLQACLPLLSQDAAIVLIGAQHERMRLPGLSAYAASKAGLEAFAEAFQKEQRQKRVIVLRPGAVDTPFWRKVPFRLPPNALTPESVAAWVLQAIEEYKKGVFDL